MWSFLFICSFINIQLKEIKKEKSPLFLHKPIINKSTINNNKYDLFFLTDNNYFIHTPFNKTKNSEIIFKENAKFTITFLFCGIFIMSYGAYYYRLSLLFHYTFFLYHFCVLILPEINILLYQYVFIFSGISGILIYSFISTDNKASKQYKIQKILYGIILGCFIHKIIIYYINIFVQNNEISIIINVLYYISFFICILIFGIINYFIPDYLTFLPCSTISSSFYIINFIDIVTYTETNTQKNVLETFLTSFILQLIIIIWSILYQIFHIRYKFSEEPNFDNNEIEISRMSSCISSINNVDTKLGIESNEQTYSTPKENELDDEDEDYNINEQED